MTHINLTDEEVAEIVAKIGVKVDDPLGGIFVVSLAGTIIAELVEATEEKEKKETDKKMSEIIRAGLWTIQTTEMPSKKVRLVMMFRDHLRVDRIFENKHEALCAAFNILVS